MEVLLDVVYNPLNTKLIAEAKLKGLKSFGGLLMLVAQATEAAGHFQNKIISDEMTLEIYHDLLLR